RQPLPEIPETQVPGSSHRPHIGTRVLLAEDNVTNQIVGSAMLRNLGCHVDVAANGREAIQMVETFPYEIVFMDCEMPEMDGFEATAAIRRRSDGKSRLPIVAVTAQAMQGDKGNCLLAGMDDYIPKPAKQEDFAAALKRWAPAKQQEDGDEIQQYHAENEKTASVGTANSSSSPLSSFSSGASGAPSALNANAVARLRALGEVTEPSLMSRIFTSFLNEGAERIKLLRISLDGSDAKLLRKTAHTLRGASLSIGALHMAELAQQLEALDKAHSAAGAGALIEQIEGEFERIKAEIAKLDMQSESSFDKAQS
ncbi:MAG: response regulator, partial [Nitrosospira sp.]